MWIAVLVLTLVTAVPTPARAATTWSRNLYVASGVVYQDPYFTACTAAAVMTMLNTIAIQRTGGSGFGWTPYRVRNSAIAADTRDLTSILSFERSHDTLRSTSPGSDAHGWRNALNFYGWGQAAMTDPARMVYQDRAYTSFDAAVKAAVTAIARLGMPVGMLGWAGGHAQMITGYVVVGADPAVSDAFSVQSVFLSDPLRSDRILNLGVSLGNLRAGNLHYRFQANRETDSPYRDAFRPGSLRASVSPTGGASEWYRRWVLVVPVQGGLPTPTPTPTPEPIPEPTATAIPDPTADPSPPAGSSGAPSPDPTAGSSPSVPPTQGPAPTPPPSPTATPASPTATPPSPTATPAPATEPAASASPAP